MMKFLSNRGPFGRLMGLCWILFAANLLFILSCLPIVTAGAGLSALYYTTLRTLRGDGELHPIAAFWKGFKDNWKQATAAWLALLLPSGFARGYKTGYRGQSFHWLRRMQRVCGGRCKDAQIFY